MRFDYVPYEGSWLPLVPVVFKCKKKRLPAIGALIDTGATHSILPLEIAPELGITIDPDDCISMKVAGGGLSNMFPSPVPIDFILKDPDSHMEHQWRGQVFFSLGQRPV